MEQLGHSIIKGIRPGSRIIVKALDSEERRTEKLYTDPVLDVAKQKKHG